MKKEKITKTYFNAKGYQVCEDVEIEVPVEDSELQVENNKILNTKDVTVKKDSTNNNNDTKPTKKQGHIMNFFSRSK